MCEGTVSMRNESR